jgi:LmbE family N-acetylglucosaminyl deacetylase
MSLSRRVFAAPAWPCALLATLFLAPPALADPRPPAAMDAAEIRLALEKLQVTGSVLFVAAHPDDENTAFIAAMSKGRKVRTAYLSMTRGDGGQNLIGTETGIGLGVIRTQELIGARRIDGGEQYFTRALDFGYSKTADETMAKWGREEILSDFVRVIRAFRPDVIVTRFGIDGTGGHGHHTASAMLAEEAFVAAADPVRFPEQVAAGLKPWAAKRILWNTWRPQLENRDAKLPPLLTLDVGEYAPLLGRAYSEIAGESRSLHRSQGFGAPERRGSIVNYLEHRGGEPAQKDLFEGVELGWGRVAGGERVAAALKRAAADYRPEDPAAAVPALLEAHAAMAALPDDPLVVHKRRELLGAIRACAGLWFDAIAAQPAVTPGGRARVTLTALNRSRVPMTLESVELPFGAEARLTREARADSGKAMAGRALESNRPVSGEASLTVPTEQPLTQPYWLARPTLEGRFDVAEAALIGLPENPPAMVARFRVRADGQRLVFEVPLVHRWVDRVQGERYRDLAVVPPAAVHFPEATLLFADARPKPVQVHVVSGDQPVRGTLRLELPAGWKSEPAQHAVDIASPKEERAFTFTLTPGSATGVATARALLETGGRAWSQDIVTIDYEHIPLQLLFPPSEARLVRADVKRAGDDVAYVMGSGDEGPEALRQMGFRVTLLSDDDLATSDLSRFRSMVIGVRAYNTRPRLASLNPRLMDWVAKGGRLVVQYQTSDLPLAQLGPRPFTVSRDRVSVEQAEPRFLQPQHALLTTPNRITAADFDGWVQERGLYFANPWDASYQTVLSFNDPGETPKDGGLVVARHGQGTYLYTGLAFFRQLPAGVPGAWRLFANLVSTGR